MNRPIPPGNGTKSKDVWLRWRAESDRALRGLWWVEAIALDEAADERVDVIFVTEMKEALLSVVEMLEIREKRDALRTKISQLENVTGRTTEEAAAYREKARELRERQKLD